MARKPKNKAAVKAVQQSQAASAKTKLEREDRTKMSIDDLSLPRTIITRLAKYDVPENTQLQRDAIQALIKSATVFINYITASANDIVAENGRKTITPNEIIAALELLGFDQFTESLRTRLEETAKKRPKPSEPGSSAQDAVQLETDSEHPTKKAKTENEEDGGDDGESDGHDGHDGEDEDDEDEEADAVDDGEGEEEEDDNEEDEDETEDISKDELGISVGNDENDDDDDERTVSKSEDDEATESVSSRPFHDPDQGMYSDQTESD